MGGIVSGWRKTANGSPEEVERKEDQVKDEDKKNEGEIEKNDEQNVEKDGNESDAQSNQNDEDQQKISVDDNPLLPIEQPTEPEKPLDLIHDLDLFPSPTLICQQIRSHLNHLQTLSEEVKNAFLSHPSQSFTSKRRVPTEKILFESSVHLKELKHQWLRPFETHFKNLKKPILCLDLHFRQITSFQASPPSPFSVCLNTHSVSVCHSKANQRQIFEAREDPQSL
jgi:hypothetical protein